MRTLRHDGRPGPGVPIWRLLGIGAMLAATAPWALILWSDLGGTTVKTGKVHQAAATTPQPETRGTPPRTADVARDPRILPACDFSGLIVPTGYAAAEDATGQPPLMMSQPALAMVDRGAIRRLSADDEGPSLGTPAIVPQPAGELAEDAGSPSPAAQPADDAPTPKQPEYSLPKPPEAAIAPEEAGTDKPEATETEAKPAADASPPAALDPPHAARLSGPTKPEPSAKPAETSTPKPADAVARSSAMEGVAREADRHSRHGFDLANRGALLAARAEFISALRLIAQGLDAEQHVATHSQALANAIIALKEADDFLPRGAKLEAELNLRMIVDGHRTRVLKDADQRTLSALTALRNYLSFAQQQFAAAVEKEVAGSMALYGLGKLYAAMVAAKLADIPATEAKAVVCFQAALLVYPQNHLAANELGVLLARFGNLSDARRILEHGARLNPNATALGNLAVVYRRSGRMDLAEQIAARADGMRQAESRRTGIVQTPQATVQWVSPEALARDGREPPAAAGMTPTPRAAATQTPGPAAVVSGSRAAGVAPAPQATAPRVAYPVVRPGAQPAMAPSATPAPASPPVTAAVPQPAAPRVAYPVVRPGAQPAMAPSATPALASPPVMAAVPQPAAPRVAYPVIRPGAQPAAAPSSPAAKVAPVVAAAPQPEVPQVVARPQTAAPLARPPQPVVRPQAGPGPLTNLFGPWSTTPTPNATPWAPPAGRY